MSGLRRYKQASRFGSVQEAERPCNAPDLPAPEAMRMRPNQAAYFIFMSVLASPAAIAARSKRLRV